MIEVRCLTVGPVQENCYLVRRPGSASGLVIDPGEEAPRILVALADMGVTDVAAILLTHTHFDHVGAVAPVARATRAPVYCPTLEREVLANIMDFVPWPGFGPFDSYDADELISGGEHLAVADLDIDVLFTPGHSPGHVSFSIPAEGTLLSGDVLFEGSVGRVDLPGGDWPTLERSIATLIDVLPGETRVLPGHMGETTLGRELVGNPFLQALAAR